MKFMNIDRWLLFLCKVIDFNVLGRCGKMVSEINVNNLEGGLYFEGYNSYFKEIKWWVYCVLIDDIDIK